MAARRLCADLDDLWPWLQTFQTALWRNKIFARDFHPLDNANDKRTNKNGRIFYCQPVSLSPAVFLDL